MHLRRLVLALLLCAGLTGCATYRVQIDGVEHALARGQPKQALTALKKTDPADRDRVLYLLNRGLLQHYMGDYSASNASFEAAKSLNARLQATSISETAAASTVTETLSSYVAPTYELLLAHYYQMLNYLEAGDLDGARVEALQTDVLLGKAVQDDDLPPVAAALRYLTGLIYQARGEQDDARIAYVQALDRFQSDDASLRPPRDLLDRCSYLARVTGAADTLDRCTGLGGDPSRAAPVEGEGQVVVLVETGFAPALVDASAVSQDPQTGEFYRIAVPALRPRPTRVGTVDLSGGNRTASGAPLDNITLDARASLNARMPGLMARAVARNVARHAVDRRLEDKHPGAAGLANFLGTVFDQADTRSWSLLPEQLYLVALSLPAGTHQLELTLYDGGGRTLARKTLSGIAVQPGSLTVTDWRWARAR